MKRYNNYHKHDHLSNLCSPDCNVKAEDYIKKCVEYGHTNYFTTNHGSFGDIFEARTLCNKYGLRCIAGIEGYIVPNPIEKDKSNYHIIIIPTTDAARKKMNYVSTRANTDGFYYKPRIFIQDLLDLNPSDVYITTACCAGLLKDDRSINEIFIPLLKHFSQNMLLEVQNHQHSDQIAICKKALEFQDKYGLRIVAANDSHYIDEQGKQERLELLKGKGITYDAEDSFILDFPTAEVMFDRFKDQGVFSENQIEEAINNTLIFDECEEIQLDYSIKMPTIYPNLTPAERVKELKKIINKKFAQIRKEEHIEGEEYEKYKAGIKYEMDIIEKTNDEVHTADYFLFNTKNVDLAVNKYGGVLTRGGRGSCASFYINRILGMTQLDRFKINLPIFPDRFASTARLLENRSIPDIDMNIRSQEPFVSASRELLGEHGCYPMYAPNTMQLSEAFRNVCRSKGLPYDEVNEIAKDIESHINDAKWRPLIEEANKYVGTIVAGSVHPCAHLLDNKDLRYEYGITRLGDNLCVLITSAEADEYKVLKNDYLIVSVWKLIDETFKKVGLPIIPAHQLLEEIKDDDRIWNLFRDGITCTLNQVDSDNGTRQAKQYGIKSFEDGALIAAAIRPSFDSWREKFLNHEEYSTGSEQLDDVLAVTHHYILYQESLMQYFEWLGVTPAESIGLIKKISKKRIKPEDFANLEDRIKKQWIINTGSDNMFDITWKMIQNCIQYGFCSAHAAACSLDMCYGAYLKVHYPFEYYTVCLDHYSGDEERTRKLIKELKYFNINLGAIKFRESRAGHAFNKDQRIIYKGISSIKFMNSAVAEDLYALRDNHYDTFMDLLVDIKHKTSVNSKQLDILIHLDFFSEFGEPNALLKQVSIFDKIYGKKQFKIDKITEMGFSVDEFVKFSQKHTDKIIKFEDTMPLLKHIVSTTEYPKTTKYDKLCYEWQYLGYIQTVLPKMNKDYYFVTGIKGKQSRMVTVYQIRTGQSTTYKIRKKLFDTNPIEEGQCIHIKEFTNDFKWRKVIDENGKDKWEQTGEHEMLITKYSVLTKDRE